jgi:NAD(P)-dependent dehydrogenase (short-subunit alcohol dehydrogenase family)
LRLEKVVAITGSGSGLGRESALLFASEGAKVVTSDVVSGRAQKVAAQVEAAGGHAVGIDGDVRIEVDMERLVSTAVEEYGRLDVMFANAGVPEIGFGSTRFEDLPLEQFNHVVAVNLTGVFLAWKHAARQFIAQGAGGTLLATTSASAFAAFDNFPAYSASKAGANGLVRAAAVELGRYGIRANALCPMWGMSANFPLPPDAEVLGKSYEEMQDWDPASRPMPLDAQRPPTLRDNARLALFLASDDSAYMSGQCIAATDGATFARLPT